MRKKRLLSGLLALVCAGSLLAGCGKKDSFQLDADAIYTVAVCGATDALREAGKVHDTGILGLTAMEDYLRQFETFYAKDIRWE